MLIDWRLCRAISTAEFEESTDLRETRSDLRINWIRLGFSNHEHMFHVTIEQAV